LGAAIPKFATEALFENFRIGDDLLAGREHFFDRFTAPRRAFLLVLPQRNQLGMDFSGFPNVAAHFKRM
jgi:glutathione S-transferase